MENKNADLVITKLNELGIVLSPEIHYRLETVFSGTYGDVKAHEVRKKFELVEQIEPVLVSMLLKDEQVLFVSKGEIRFRKIIIVLTNLRLLLMHSNRYEPFHQPYWSIYYSQVETLKNSWIGTPQFRLVDGKKMTFNDFPQQDHRTLRMVFQDVTELLKKADFDPAVSQSRENLCGNCFAVVPQPSYECEDCGASFWTPAEMGFRCLIFPPWENFVLKENHHAWNSLVTYLAFQAMAFQILSHRGFAYAWLILVISNASAALVALNQMIKGRYIKDVSGHVSSEFEK